MGLLFNRRRRWRSRSREQARPSDILQRKFLALHLVILLLFGALILQLVRMQVIDAESYQERAEHNRLRLVPVMTSRGLIYDRHGELLVENVPSFAAGVVPADLPDEEFLPVLAELDRLLDIPLREVALEIAAVKESKDPFSPVIVKADLDEETAFRLREAEPGLAGVHVLVEPRRHYIEGPLLAHVLGYVGRLDEAEYVELRDRGYELNDRIGKTGVEAAYESMLRGVPGRKQVEVDASGREIRTLNSLAPRPGHSVVLALDLDLQRKVTEILQGAMGSSTNAAAVVMDVRSGEVLATVSLPSFDNNLFSGEIDEAQLQRLLDDPAKPLVNHAIAEMYPPGSTFKQVTGVAALQEGIATPSTTITSRGYITVPNQYNPEVVYVFRDWAALGTLNFYGGVAMSSDVYFYYLAGGYYQQGVEIFRGLGASRLASYARAFGLGAPTGIDLPGESPGLVPDPRWKEQTLGEPWVTGDTYNFGIGQGYLATTPLQMVRVTAAIANGGDVLVPRLVREVVDADGRLVRPFERVVQRHLEVSPDNLAIFREAMRQAASWGTARRGAVPGVSVAGKTGTAEFGLPLANGQYESHGWFTGFAPFEDPQVAVVVFLEKGNGSIDAAPAAAKILDYYFHRQSFARQAETR
ncbi:MAG: penicillin-binding protein 2 [Dehalococcoidia bacterium]